MQSGAQSASYVDASPLPASDGDDAALLRLCTAFITCAKARSAEGARLDSMPWSSAVDCGYGELSRGPSAHQNMLTEILASPPITVAGLLAKAQAVRVHLRNPESEPMSYAALADDIIRLLAGSPEVKDTRSKFVPGRPHLVPASVQTSTEA